MVPSVIKLFELKIKIKEKKNSIFYIYIYIKKSSRLWSPGKPGYSYDAYPVGIKQQLPAPHIEAYVVYFQTPFPPSFTPALL